MGCYFVDVDGEAVMANLRHEPTAEILDAIRVVVRAARDHLVEFEPYSPADPLAVQQDRRLLDVVNRYRKEAL